MSKIYIKNVYIFFLFKIKYFLLVIFFFILGSPKSFDAFILKPLESKGLYKTLVLLRENLHTHKIPTRNY